MAIFYAPEILNTPLLPEEESLHCCKVLRLKEGEMISIIDGVGGFFSARIVVSHPKRTEVEILDKKFYHKKSFGIHIAIAPTKNMDRMEWFLEKATEIGVDEITPLLCSHSERKQVNAERMLKILVSATKQSKNMFLPRLNPLCPFEEFVMKAQAEGKFIAHCVDTDKKSLLNNCPKNKNVIVLIGPEGDFSDVEIALALSKGFTPVTLGDSRLRTETAGVVACHIANLVQQL